MSKKIELQILKDLLAQHRRLPVEFMCIEVREMASKMTGENYYEGEVGKVLVAEIRDLIDPYFTVESMVKDLVEEDVDRYNPIVVKMRTDILETLIARRKS